MAEKLQIVNSMLDELAEDATKIISNLVAVTSISNTPTVGEAKDVFETFFNKLKVTRSDIIPYEALSWVGTTPDDVPLLDLSFDEMIAGEAMRVNGNKLEIDINGLMIYWENSVVKGRSHGYYYTPNPHESQHIKFHIQGYKTYEKVQLHKGKKSLVVKNVIKGRDILYSAVMLSVPKILKDTKNKLLKEVFS